MWKKCLMLSLIFTCIYTIKTMAFSETTVSSNPFSITYNNISNIENYDFFTYSGYVSQIIYKNTDSSYAIIFSQRTTSSHECYLHFVNNSNNYSFALQWSNNSSLHYAGTNGFIIIPRDFNNTFYYYATAAFDTNNNICFWDEDFNISIKSSSHTYFNTYDINEYTSDDNDYGGLESTLTDYLQDYNINSYIVVPLIRCFRCFL